MVSNDDVKNECDQQVLNQMDSQPYSLNGVDFIQAEFAQLSKHAVDLANVKMNSNDSGNESKVDVDDSADELSSLTKSTPCDNKELTSVGTLPPVATLLTVQSDKIATALAAAVPINDSN